MALAAVVGCGGGGGPPVDRKDTVKLVRAVVRYESGVAAALGLPDDFTAPKAGTPVTYNITDRGTCKRVRDELATVKPGSADPTAHDPLIGDVTVRTGWGRVIQLTWHGPHFTMPDGRALRSPHLHALLAEHVREAVEKAPATRPARRSDDGPT